jgi:peptidoglycan/LPS O-acetylase OafA/YrhL
MTNTETLSPSGSRKVLRRIGAVLGGLVLVVILDTAIDVVMHATGIYPPWFQPMRTSLWLVAIGYRMIDGTIGGYVAARLAPDRPVAHALALGSIGFVLSIGGVAATWNKGPEFGPKWYPLALVFVSLPCALLGGFLRARQLRTR